MNESSVIAFMDEMSKIAEPSWHREAMARFGVSKSKNSTRHHWAKEKSAADMAALLLKEAAKIGPVGNIRRTLSTMVNHPVRGVARGAKATVREFKKHPIIGTVGAAGLGMGAYEAAKKEDPTGQGRSRFHRAARFAGETAGGLIGAPFGLLSGGIAGSFVGGQIGKAVGSAYDRMRRPVAPAPAMVQGPPQAMQSQRM